MMFINYYSGGKLKVFGEGLVNAIPDMAEVVVGIITDNAKLEIAQKENSLITQQVLENIKSMGVASKDIQTQNYSINVKYDYIDGKQVFRSYEVSNYLKVLIRDIKTTGAVIDAAVKGGANSVNSIRFMVSDTSRYYNEALKSAVKDAQQKAIVIADKLRVNVNIVPVQIVEQGSTAISPLKSSFLPAEAATNIEPGENKIISKIEAIFTYI